MKILLWGAYQQGNFGDDLMAWVFSKFLAAQGHEVAVFGLDGDEAKAFGVRVERDLQNGVREADVVIVGGGAVLEKWLSIRAIARTALVRPVRLFEKSYSELAAAVSKYKKPVLLASVGSDGIKSVREVSPFRTRLFRTGLVKGGSIRIPTDDRLFSELGVSVCYAPDILLATPALLGLSRRDLSRDRVGHPSTVLINLHKRYSGVADKLCTAIRSEWPGTTVFATNSHLSTSGLNYEWSPPPASEVSALKYTGAKDLIDTLYDIDLVISSKLHIGITAMSFGSAFVSVGGRNKVAQQLKLLGCYGSGYVSHEEAFGPGLMSSVRASLAARAQLQATLKAEARAALEHLSILVRHLDAL